MERLLSDDLDDSSEKVDFEEKRLSSRQSRTNGVPGGDGPGSTSASGVFVQGAAKDKSWRAQVSRLRESTTRNHNLHLRSVGLNPEDDIGNLDDDGFDDDMRIRVVVRKRPMAEGEASNKEDFDAIHTLTHKDYSTVLVYQPKTRVDLTKEVETIPFAFDNALTTVPVMSTFTNELFATLFPAPLKEITATYLPTARQAVARPSL